MRGRNSSRLNQLIERSKHAWHGVKLYQPDWSRDSHRLAFDAESREGLQLHLILNADWDRSNSNCHRWMATPGTGGSIPPSIRRTTSSNGQARLIPPQRTRLYR